MAMAGLGGCAVSKKTVVPTDQMRPTLDATQAQLLGRYNQFAHSVQTLNAGVDMIPTAGSTYSGVIEQYHDVYGFILAMRPAYIRVIGQAPVLATNIFDMVSDGTTFRIFIPSKNKFIEGPSDVESPSARPIENLRPQHLVEALLPPEIPPQTPVLFEESDDSRGRFYILTVLAPAEALSTKTAQLQITRKIWFDRTNLSFARMQIYGRNGRLDSNVRYANWQPSGAILYPWEIKISRPHNDYELDITITKISLNEPLKADGFNLAQPAGSELVRVGDETGAAQP